VKACFVLGDVVSCQKKDPKDVMQFVLVGRHEKYPSAGAVDVQGPVEEHRPVVGDIGNGRLVEIRPLCDEIDQGLRLDCGAALELQGEWA